LVIQVIRLIDFAFAFAGTKRILFKKVFKINIEGIYLCQFDHTNQMPL
jgi:hypothetical protein